MALLTRKDISKGIGAALWFMFLTFPLMVIKVNPIEQVVIWRWCNMVLVGLFAFVGTVAAQGWRNWREVRQLTSASEDRARLSSGWCTRLMRYSRLRRAGVMAGCLFFLAFPALFSIYQVNIMTTALLWVVLGLGLNIVVGVAGLLDLGYVAFYAVGAYTYALLHLHFGISFWVALPLGGLFGALFGILLGFPVLRLRGDYLAIVTLGFGQIVRLVLENWGEFSKGPSGISNIPAPPLFGLDLSLEQNMLYLYYLMVLMVACTIFVINRLQNSRIGRALFALREDEIACQAMGIDKTRIKLTAFALGATWAGMAGVFFAAKNTFVNPAPFTFLDSAIILCIVVLGGMGSIAGVIIAALILILLPEYLRAFADYRMLVFGAVLVAMMIFRPQGLMADIRRSYSSKERKP